MDIQNAYNEWSYSYDQDENRTRDLDRDIVRSRLDGQHFDLDSGDRLRHG